MGYIINYNPEIKLWINFNIKFKGNIETVSLKHTSTKKSSMPSKTIITTPMCLHCLVANNVVPNFQEHLHCFSNINTSIELHEIELPQERFVWMASYHYTKYYKNLLRTMLSPCGLSFCALGGLIPEIWVHPFLLNSFTVFPWKTMMHPPLIYLFITLSCWSMRAFSTDTL